MREMSERQRAGGVAQLRSKLVKSRVPRVKRSPFDWDSENGVCMCVVCVCVCVCARMSGTEAFLCKFMDSMRQRCACDMMPYTCNLHVFTIVQYKVLPWLCSVHSYTD